MNSQVDSSTKLNTKSQGTSNADIMNIVAQVALLSFLMRATSRKHLHQTRKLQEIIVQSNGINGYWILLPPHTSTVSIKSNFIKSFQVSGNKTRQEAFVMFLIQHHHYIQENITFSLWIHQISLPPFLCRRKKGPDIVRNYVAQVITPWCHTSIGHMDSRSSHRHFGQSLDKYWKVSQISTQIYTISIRL